jgi:hypothetical protein
MKIHVIVVAVVAMFSVGAASLLVWAEDPSQPRRVVQQEVSSKIKDIGLQATRLTYIAKAHDLNDRELLEMVSHKLDLLLSLHHLMKEQAKQ